VAQQSKKFNKNAKKQQGNHNHHQTQQQQQQSNLNGNQMPLLKANRASPSQRNMSEDLISINVPTTASTASTGARVSTGALPVLSKPTACQSNEARMSARTRNLALMLIPVNFLFLAFLAPVVIAMYTYDRLWEDKLTLAVIELLSYCNFTVNFFIYFLTSSKFREEFFKFLDEVYKQRMPIKTSNSPSPTSHAANNNRLVVKNGVDKSSFQKL
jgi:hypothetical protein